MEKVCVSAWGLPKILEERLKEKYGDDWEKYVKAKAINEEELEEQVKAKAKEQQKTQNCMLIAVKRKSALFGNLFKRYTKFCHSPKSRQEHPR